jgi:hypothetical protein
MVLGDPAAGDVYGFASRRGDAAVLCLRNPSAEPRTVPAGWADLVGVDTGAVRTVFGRAAGAGAGPLTLDPFEVLLLEAAPAGEPGTP